MRVLFLGPPDSPVLAHLRDGEDDVVQTSDPLSDDLLDETRPDFLVSHGYRHLVGAAHVERFRDRAINLHISYLPWNRGADPNFWSFVEDTPKGVTIHYLDEGVDTGDVIAQREVEMREDDTFASSYARLQSALLELFREQWPAIRTGTCARRPQAGEGSSHRLRDKEPYAALLTDGWDTPVSRLRSSPR